jgi:hypothetical protein
LIEGERVAKKKATRKTRIRSRKPPQPSEVAQVCHYFERDDGDRGVFHWEDVIYTRRTPGNEADIADFYSGLACLWDGTCLIFRARTVDDKPVEFTVVRRDQAAAWLSKNFGSQDDTFLPTVRDYTEGELFDERMRRGSWMRPEHLAVARALVDAEALEQERFTARAQIWDGDPFASASIGWVPSPLGELSSALDGIVTLARAFLRFTAPMQPDQNRSQGPPPSKDQILSSLSATIRTAYQALQIPLNWSSIDEWVQSCPGEPPRHWVGRLILDVSELLDACDALASCGWVQNYQLPRQIAFCKATLMIDSIESASRVLWSLETSELSEEARNDTAPTSQRADTQTVVAGAAELASEEARLQAERDRLAAERADMKAERERLDAERQRIGYLDLMVDEEHYTISRQGFDGKVDLRGSKRLWETFLVFYRSGESDCSTEKWESALQGSKSQACRAQHRVNLNTKLIPLSIRIPPRSRRLIDGLH